VRKAYIFFLSPKYNNQVKVR